MDKSKLPELYEKLTLIGEFAHNGNETVVKGLNKSLSEVQEDAFGGVHYEKDSLEDIFDTCKNNYLNSLNDRNLLILADSQYIKITKSLKEMKILKG